MTIRGLDDDVKARLRVRAAEHGQSMEEEARQILREALEGGPQKGLGTIIHERFAALGGFEMDPPDRSHVAST
ncbi:MAG TPA: hypothetical protein VGM93_06650 [Acidimicrobiales bacterium]